MSLRFKVEVAAAALREAEEYRTYIHKRSHDDLPAAAWWDGLMAALDSLQSFPSRCPQIPEQRHFTIPLHHLLYQSHRLIFFISDKTVYIVRICHSALRPLKTLNQKPIVPRKR